MYETVKKLDPDRYVSYADDKISKGADPAVNAASIADFVMMNQYFGSWHGPAAGPARRSSACAGSTRARWC